MSKAVLWLVDLDQASANVVLHDFWHNGAPTVTNALLLPDSCVLSWTVLLSSSRQISAVSACYLDMKRAELQQFDQRWLCCRLMSPKSK